MDISALLADPVALRLEYVKSAPKLITLIVKAVQPSAVCPRCHYASARVHSRYTRTVAFLSGPFDFGDRVGRFDFTPQRKEPAAHFLV